MALSGTQWSGALRTVHEARPTHWSHASASHHHLHELIATDLALPIEVAVLILADLLPHDLEDVLGADEAITIAVEDVESLDKLLLLVCLPRFTLHQLQELREVDPH